MSNCEFKGNTKVFEMSRYIDLDIYHAVERLHPYYLEMTQEIQNQIEDHYNSKRCKLKVLELGAGTGLFTQDLIKNDYLEIDSLDVDGECVRILQGHIGGKARCIHGDAVTYCREGAYDIVVSTFAHDHIHYDSCEQFVKNIRMNLKKGGVYIMGGEILPYFETEKERLNALYLYHGFIIDKALRDGNYMLAQIEINALKSGVEMIGDFKRHEKMFEEEMLCKEFKLKMKKKMGPEHLDHVGGVFVYVCESI